MSEKKKIAVAMSGGVDSSTVAAMLVGQGHEVIGVCMRLPVYGESGEADGCVRGRTAADDARAVADRLGIRLHVLDFRETFESTVLADFTAVYMGGRTPNPCVECNRVIKFGHLLDHARRLGCQCMATGHYAKTEKNPDSGRVLLKKGADAEKDQTYFLYSLTQDQLGGAIFPLSGMTKAETRQAAREAGLPVSEKAGSQDICFLRGGDYRPLLSGRCPEALRPGPIVDRRGEVLGEHRGVAFHTIGQRRGLGIATGKPAYVIGIDVETRTVVVGDAEDLRTDRFSVSRANWIPFAQPPETLRLDIRIRYRQKTVPGTVVPTSPFTADVQTDQPLSAVTPGQSAVFYDGDTVVGGGVIA